MISPLRFPTEIHREVSELVKDFFSAHAHVDTIMVVNSCARDRAVADSDLARVAQFWRSAALTVALHRSAIFSEGIRR
jgi:hypothetical protein